MISLSDKTFKHIVLDRV